MIEDQEWIMIKRDYEGFPLFLRHPDKLDYDKLQSKYPMQIVLTHTFSFRKFDGLPEPKYNNMLEEFDNFVTAYFEIGKEGQIVLVETFGGERNYYFYTTELIDPARELEQIKRRFPGLKLEISARSDPEWKFIRKYNAEFLQRA